MAAATVAVTVSTWAAGAWAGSAAFFSGAAGAWALGASVAGVWEAAGASSTVTTGSSSAGAAFAAGAGVAGASTISRITMGSACAGAGVGLGVGLGVAAGTAARAGISAAVSTGTRFSSTSPSEETWAGTDAISITAVIATHKNRFMLYLLFRRFYNES